MARQISSPTTSPSVRSRAMLRPSASTATRIPSTSSSSTRGAIPASCSLGALENFTPRHRPLEGEIARPSHGGLRLGDHLARTRGAVGEKIHHHRRQGLGGQDIAELLVHDREGRGVSRAPSPAHVWLPDGNDLTEVPHYR